MNYNQRKERTLTFFLKKRQPLLQFHLFKYLKYVDLIKLKMVSRDGNNICDANISQDNSDQPNTLRYLMVMISLQHYSNLIKYGK